MADQTVRYRLTAEVGGFVSNVKTAGASLKELGDRATAADKQGAQFRKGLDTLGGAAGKVGLVAAAGLGAAIKVSADFDKAMSNVSAATGETAGNMEKLRAAALKAGADTVFSATQAADGIEQLAKAGVSTKDILGGGLKGALDLAAAGQIDVGEAAEAASKAMTQFGLSGQQVPHVADILSAAAGKATGDVSDFNMALAQGGTVAAQMGLSVEETVGTLGALASNALLGSDAGTSLKSSLLRLAAPSKQAAETMQALGINAYDANGQFVGMADLAGQLQDAFKGQSDSQRDAALATIFGSDAIRVANILYKEGSAGIDSWTKKVNDQGYAARQAAERLNNLAGDLEAFRGSLETALIGTGDSAQGPLRSLTQSLTRAVNAYNDLGQGAKSGVAVALTATAALGGGLFVFSKIVQGVASTREAMVQLAGSAEKANGALRTIGRGVSFALVLSFVGDLRDALGDLFNTRLEGSELGRSLESLSNGRVTGALKDTYGADLKDFASNLQLADQTLSGFYANVDRLPLIGGALTFPVGPSVDAVNNIEKMDEALAQLVESGQKAQAVDVFSRLAAAAKAAGVPIAQLKAQMPEYATALANAKDEAGGASTATDKYAGSLGNSRSAANAAAAAVTKQTAAMQENRSQALDAFDAQTAYARALKEAQAQGRKSSAGIKGNSEAALKNRDTISSLAAAWNNQSAAVKNNQAKFAQARRDFIATATAMGVPRAAARALAKQLLEIPQQRVVRVNAETNQAMSGINAVENRLRLLDGKTATTYVRTIQGATIRSKDTFGAGPGAATGGYIRGPGTTTSDSIPALLSDKEFVIKAASVEKYGVAMFHALNAGTFADGGQVQRLAAGGKVRSALRDFDLGRNTEARPELRDLARELRKLNIALPSSFDRLGKRARSLDNRLDATTKSLKSLRDTRSQVVSTARGSFNGDLFGNGLSGALLQLEADRNDSRNMASVLRRLRRSGLDGAAYNAVATSGDLNTARQLARGGRSQVRQFERLYGERASAQRGLGREAGADLTADIRSNNRQVDRLVKKLNRLEKRIEGSVARGAERGTRKGQNERTKNVTTRRSVRR